MDASIIIPTFQRPAKLAACLAALGAQATDAFEVLVGFDGPDAGALAAAREACPPSLRARCTFVECPRSGYTAVRNALLPCARGRLMLSTNDDVIPDPGWVQAHVEAHREARGRCVTVVGASPWRIHQPDRLFDRLVRETSMVFFYPAMEAASAEADTAPTASPSHDWGFRHNYGLNFSAPLAAVRAVGGFTRFPAWYGYEDNEIAFKLRERFDAPVLYRPQARLTHDHRMEPDDYLRREFSLGYAALGFARTSPACARAVFSRDIAAAPEFSYARESVTRERTAAARLLPAFRALADLPASTLDTPHAAALRAAFYDQHLPLKRWMWRAGLIAAVEGRPADAIEWPG